MSRKKIQRFQELNQMPFVGQLQQADALNRLKKFLDKKNKNILELGCGQGEYTLALALKNPKQKFIGVDIQGERLWRAARQVQLNGLHNVFFLRIQIENLLKYFPAKSIAKIWLTFPDPFPRRKHSKKRLTSPRFLEMYKKILKDKGQLNLKTDDLNLLEYSIDSLQTTGWQITKKIKNLYNQPLIKEELKISTRFEKKHLTAGKKIYYLKARI